MKAVFAGLVVVALAVAVAGREPNPSAPEPTVSILLGSGQGTATPLLQGCGHTGGGNIHVTQPSPDTLSVTMTGVAAAKGHPFHHSVGGLTFDLSQCFEVVFHSPKVKGAKLILWGRAVGLLRSHSHCGQNGTAEVASPGHASIHCGPAYLVALNLVPRSVGGGDNLSVHDRQGPVWVSVRPGKYTLHQTFGITAGHAHALFSKPASADFAPDPALEDRWVGKREPFHGAAKKDFGFQVILKVVADEEENGKNGTP